MDGFSLNKRKFLGYFYQIKVELMSKPVCFLPVGTVSFVMVHLNLFIYLLIYLFICFSYLPGPKEIKVN